MFRLVILHQISDTHILIRAYDLWSVPTVLIEYKNIILRDMKKEDIVDYVRWFTSETEWANTDAPWEPIDTNYEKESIYWSQYYSSIKDISDDICRSRFEIEFNNKHVGWVSSYFIDEKYEWVDKINDGQTVYRAIGIDICDVSMWGHSIGEKALCAFINYYFDNGNDELYTQTWSGNVRMIRLAKKLGFVECSCNKGTREVYGQKYDALTFRLENKQ